MAARWSQRTLSRTPTARMPEPAARAAGSGGQQKPLPCHRGPAAPEASKPVARRGWRTGGRAVRCARRKPKESPQARTRLRTGQSGANAPDRNRRRARLCATRAGRPTKHNSLRKLPRKPANQKKAPRRTLFPSAQGCLFNKSRISRNNATSSGVAAGAAGASSAFVRAL